MPGSNASTMQLLVCLAMQSRDMSRDVVPSSEWREGGNFVIRKK
jgi:hypothetical protein